MNQNAENRLPLRLEKAILIRCWQQEGKWRFMLEDVATRERQVCNGVAERVERLMTVLQTPTNEK